MRDFIRLPRRIYKGNLYYVPDLDRDVKHMLSPRNAALKHAEMQAFIAYNEKKEAVGRIAGIINHRANEKWNTRTARFGLIEFIDNPRVAAALLQAVEQWSRERGMDSIQGPMGIFNFDKAGMLIEDFDQPATMTTIYNPPYYPRHLEALGYQKKVDWVQIKIDIPKEIRKSCSTSSIRHIPLSSATQTFPNNKSTHTSNITCQSSTKPSSPSWKTKKEK